MNTKDTKGNHILLCLAGLLLLLSLGGSLAARQLPGFANLYSHSVYHLSARIFYTLDGWLPFSLSELLLYLLLLSLLLLCFRLYRPLSEDVHADREEKRRARRRLARRYAERLLFLLSLLFFLYTFHCGINYYRDSFSIEAGIQPRSYSAAELRTLCGQLAEELSEEEAFSSSEAADFAFLRSAGKEGQRAMSRLGARYPRLRLHYPYPKPLLLSRTLSVQQLTGIYSPFTVEANYNREMPRYSIPFTICHELSHLAGYMQEEEANFIAFLACRSSEDPYFRYSASLSAFVYAGNELAKADPKSYHTLYQTLPASVRQELSREQEFWDHYASAVSDAADRLNDHYLKANGQSAGTKSYGQVVDLLLWYYLDAEEGK